MFVRQMFSDLWFDFRFGSLGDKIIVSVIYLLLGLAVLLVLSCAYYFYDSLNISTGQEVGIVTNKHYESPSVVAGPFPFIMVVPEKFSLVVFIKDKSGIRKAAGTSSKSLWNKINIGDRVLVEFGHGRLSGDIHIKSLGKIE